MDSTARILADDHQRLQSGLLMELLIEDLEVISELKKISQLNDRNKYALQALKIGVLALKQARGEIDVEQIRQTGDRLIEQLQHKLEDHSRTVNDRVSSQLKEYFDPQSGRLQERLKRLLQKDGELEQILGKLIGNENSQLVQTLSSHIGTDSPLLKLFDPDRSGSLPMLLKQMVETELGTQRTHILEQFSLDKKESALSRFLTELALKQGELSGELHNKVDLAIKEFSQDNEQSALNKLLKNVKTAQETITAEFSLNEEKSALSRLKLILEQTQQSIQHHLSLDDDNSALSRIKKEILTIIKEQQETAKSFQQEVRVTLESLKTRKEEALKGTRQGIEFEEMVCQFLQLESQKLGDLCTPTGNEAGLIPRSKKGDCVIELGADSIAPSEKIVVEAKQVAGYTLKRAKEEIEEARHNRGAQIGVFVFSKRAAPQFQEPLKRIADDIYVIWDPEDQQTDTYLQAAYILARALCIRQSQMTSAQTADYLQIEQSILEIERKTQQLDEIETWSTTIKNNAEKILAATKKIHNSLTKEIETLKDKSQIFKQAT